jgi:SAM-dependent methyltransferase
MGLQKAEDCSACGSKLGSQFLYEKRRYRIKKCPACKLAFTDVGLEFNPQTLYDESYYQGQQEHGYSDYLGSERCLRKEFAETVKFLRNSAQGHGKLVEIGCAYGFFLSEASNYYECAGLEIAPEAVKFCRARGLNVEDADLEMYFQNKTFDIVVMLDVIEHLKRPHEVIATLSKNAKPGSYLLLTTGDRTSFCSRITGRFWRLMTPPHHLFFFSKESLRLLLEKNGYTLISVQYPWKRVPLGLIPYQVLSGVGMKRKIPGFLSKISFPINLFDAMRILAKKN